MRPCAFMPLHVHYTAATSLITPLRAKNCFALWGGCTIHSGGCGYSSQERPGRAACNYSTCSICYDPLQGRLNMITPSMPKAATGHLMPGQWHYYSMMLSPMDSAWMVRLDAFHDCPLLIDDMMRPALCPCPRDLCHTAASASHAVQLCIQILLTAKDARLSGIEEFCEAGKIRCI